MRGVTTKRGIEMPFIWVFAIVAGVVILLTAIYSAGKIIKTGERLSSAEGGREIGVLINPLVTSFESGKTTEINTRIESIIYNRCNSDTRFGKQIIRVSEKRFEKWSEADINVQFSNKYIFSKEEIRGKNFFVFSKPFEFPFKISDLIYLTPAKEEYCFINLPENLRRELVELNQKNLIIESCHEESIKVCFNSNSDCDIKVDYGEGVVEKNGSFMYFKTDALMYAAIFSDPGIYECQLKRIMNRAKELATLYKRKQDILRSVGCENFYDDNFQTLLESLDNFNSSEDLYIIHNIVNRLTRDNNLADCKLW
ncbi:MAG: hypothetical protein QXU40_00675 [Candidatus Pacearchaeota archaeon]